MRHEGRAEITAPESGGNGLQVFPNRLETPDVSGISNLDPNDPTARPQQKVVRDGVLFETHRRVASVLHLRFLGHLGEVLLVAGARRHCGMLSAELDRCRKPEEKGHDDRM